jgi:hypothetical protein
VQERAGPPASSQAVCRSVRCGHFFSITSFSHAGVNKSWNFCTHYGIVRDQLMSLHALGCFRRAAVDA